ncbi:antitoxin VapB family protein [Candidatus Woesearchaeota archaeon]|nr:antitoxin VapB family protein [Candidatus Woesearchaeota archaeon]
MSTKTITITDEAYNRLKYAKSGYESFTDAILRITKKDPLSQLAGILTEKEADELEERIKLSRQKTEERLARTRKMLE